MKDLTSALVQAVKQGFPIYFATEAEVVSVKAPPQKLVDVKFDDGSIHRNIGYKAHGKPSVGSKCIVIFRDNVQDREFAASFSKYDELEINLGTGRCTLSAKDVGGVLQAKVVVPGTEVMLNGSDIEASVGAHHLKGTAAAGWEFTGPVTFNDDVTMDKKLDVTGETTLEGTKWRHNHNYTDTPVGPSQTGSPLTMP